MVNPARLVALAVVYLMRRLVFVKRELRRACDREQVQRVWGASRVASEGHHRGTMSVPLCMRHVSRQGGGRHRSWEEEKERAVRKVFYSEHMYKPSSSQG